MSSTTRVRPASKMMRSIIGAILFTWFGTGALLLLTASGNPSERPLTWLVLVVTYASAVGCCRDVAARWKRGEGITLRPSGPVLATVELLLGLPLLVGAVAPAITHVPFGVRDLNALGGGLVLVTSGVVGFLSIARR
jgi:hypothetical protein